MKRNDAQWVYGDIEGPRKYCPCVARCCRGWGVKEPVLAGCSVVVETSQDDTVALCDVGGFLNDSALLLGVHEGSCHQARDPAIHAGLIATTAEEHIDGTPSDVGVAAVDRHKEARPHYDANERVEDERRLHHQPTWLLNLELRPTKHVIEGIGLVVVGHL